MFWLFFSTVAAGIIIDILPTASLAFMFIFSQLKQHSYQKKLLYRGSSSDPPCCMILRQQKARGTGVISPTEHCF